MPAELRSPGSIARVCLIVFAILFTFLGQAQTTPDSDQFPIFRTSTSLVLVDVMALDPTSGLPINNLTREDFRMYDNDAEVPITTFDAGAHFDTRSIALWFVVICGEQNRSGAASDLFIGNEASFRPALDDLDKNDRVGVAHWCDNGDFKLDQPPTENKDAAIAKLGQALQPIPFIAPPGNRIGEIAFQRLVRSIISNA